MPSNRKQNVQVGRHISLVYEKERERQIEAVVAEHSGCLHRSRHRQGLLRDKRSGGFGLHSAAGFAGLALSGLFCLRFCSGDSYGRKLLEARSHSEVINRSAVGVGPLMDGFITICLPVSLVVMLAGAGAGLAEQYGIPSVVGSTGHGHGHRAHRVTGHRGA